MYRFTKTVVYKRICCSN